MTAEEVKLSALRGNEALYCAHIAAHWMQAGLYDEAQKWPDFLELFADAINNHSRFEPTTHRRRLIESHAAAWNENAKRISKGVDDSDKPLFVLDRLKAIPTLQEWKRCFKTRYPNVPLLDDGTFRRASRELSCLPYRKAGGRPRGGRDRIKRTRRIESVQKFRAKKVRRW